MNDTIFTVADMAREMYKRSTETRIKGLSQIKAPEIMITGLQQLIEDFATGKFKLPGEIRGSKRKYLVQPFTEGYYTLENKRYVLVFKVEGACNAIKIFTNRWDALEISTWGWNPTVKDAKPIIKQ